ncbi:MAG: TIGR02147 family protein, partial [Proteobacteria bacterium]
MWKTDDYRSVLREILTDRVKRNPSYSLRAFAGQLGIAPSMLSGVLRGKRNLSVQAAFDVAEKLGLEDDSTQHFCLLVQYAVTKSVSQKEALRDRIVAVQPGIESKDLSLDVFKSMADSDHYATLILLELNDRIDTRTNAIAKRIGISVIEAQSVLERLTRLDLIEVDAQGHYSRISNEYIVSRSQFANQALREFHQSTLAKASESLTTQSPQEKFVGSETMTFDPAKLPEVNAALEECFAKIKTICASGHSQ